MEGQEPRSSALPWRLAWALCQSPSLAYSCVSLWGSVSKSGVPRGSKYARLAAPGLRADGSPRQLEVRLQRGFLLCSVYRQAGEVVGSAGLELGSPAFLSSLTSAFQDPRPPHLLCSINGVPDLGGGNQTGFLPQNPLVRRGPS